MTTPYNRALDLLAARAYSTHRLRRKLLEKNINADEVEAVIVRLTNAGLLDDRQYALSYARSKLVGAGSSRRRVVQELAQRGVARDIAEQAVVQVLEDEEVDTRAVVEALAQKKAKTLAGLDPAVARRRLYGFLARKGYELDDIQAAVRAALG